MIKRYSRKEVTKVWDEKNKYQLWLNIEIAVAQAMEKLKIIPKGVSSRTKKKLKLMLIEYMQLKKKCTMT